MNKVKLIGIIILVIILIFQIVYVNKVSNNYDILQVNNPNSENLNKMISNRSPCIFTGVVND